MQRSHDVETMPPHGPANYQLKSPVLALDNLFWSCWPLKSLRLLSSLYAIPDAVNCCTKLECKVLLQALFSDPVLRLQKWTYQASTDLEPSSLLVMSLGAGRFYVRHQRRKAITNQSQLLESSRVLDNSNYQIILGSGAYSLGLEKIVQYFFTLIFILKSLILILLEETVSLPYHNFDSIPINNNCMCPFKYFFSYGLLLYLDILSNKYGTFTNDQSGQYFLRHPPPLKHISIE